MEVKRKSGLSECPLCGNEAVYVYYRGGVFVKCPCCECMVAKQISTTTKDVLPFESEEAAAKVWNKRNGMEVEPKAVRKRGSQPGDVLKARDRRVAKIAKVIKSREGEFISVSEISEETGIKKSVVSNSMFYVKKMYPQVTAKRGASGYRWEN